MSRKMLVVNNEHSIVVLLKYNLEATSYGVVVTFDGDEALGEVESEQPGSIILDVMLSKKDGIDVCKAVRVNKNLVPTLMLTTKNSGFDQILGLELGADDYMTEPFSPREVVTRMRTILRRSQFVKEVEETDDDITIGSICIRPDYLEVYRHNELLEPTPKEFGLLLCLIGRQGRVITRGCMLSMVWSYEFIEDSRTADVYISHLRGRLEDNSKEPQLIETVRGLGCKLGRPKEQR